MRKVCTDRLPKTLTPSLISLAIASLFAPPLANTAFGLPTGAQVASGQATITRPSTNTLNIQNTPGAIVNWQQFNIGAGESVRIQQQNAASAILNRVVGGEASKLLGQLNSNGRVFLINPSGIVFGQGARIDTAGFIASTLNITDANFLAGKFTFEGGHKNGIRNEGTIRSLGEIILIAPKIENSGILQTEGGDIILAAGQKVTITNLANPEVQVEIRAPDNEIVNLGRILSNGGAIAMFANRLRHSGEINATRAEVGPGGRITLRGEDELVVTPEAKIVSDGSPAGQITLESPNGTVTVEGTVSARGIAPPSQATAQTRGGRIEVLGQQVVVAATAVIDASGERGGGAIYLGGDYQGGGVALPERWAANPATQPAPVLPAPPAGTPQALSPTAETRAETLLATPVPGIRTEMTETPPADPSNQGGAGSYARQPLIPPARNPLQNARTTTIAAGARVRADAGSEGDGGTIIVWSEQSTRVYGSLSARGGALGGNGGFVETSGRRHLDIGAIPPDLGASKGLAGLWLLDPNNITIQTSGSDTNVSGSPNFVSTADGAIITVATIKAALDAGTSVTISTSSGGAQLGDITISSAIATSSATDVTLTLNAHNNININAGLSATGTGKLNVVLNANTDATGGGAASLNSGASLVLKGGAISSANGSALTVVSGTLDNVTLATNLAINGTTTLTNGLTLSGGATVTINSGSVLYYTGPQTIGGTGSLVFSGASTTWLYRNGAAATLTVGTGITVSGSGTGTAYFGYYDDETINFQGVLSANVSGKTWYLSGFNNTGNINVSAGTVRMDSVSGTGTWTNTSAVGKGIAVSGSGVLHLDDTFNASALGNIVQTGGTVNLTGTMTLDQATTNLSTVGLTGLTLNNGTIVGGGNTLTSNGTLALSSSTGTFNNVVLATDLSVTGTAYLTNGLTLAQNATTSNNATVTIGSGAYLYYSGTQTIGGTGNLVFGNGGGTAYLYRNAAATLTIGTGITISGGGTGTAILGWDSSDTINFQGTLNANVAGKTWYLGSFANTGNINVSAGTVYVDTYSGSGNWTNTNTVGKGIAVSGGVLNLGDTFNASALGNIVQTGGTVNLIGTMTLDQATTNLSTVGLTGLTLNNGTIVGGGNTLTSNGTLALSSSTGTFNNVVLATDLSVTGTAYLTNGLTLAQNATTSNNATVTIGGNAYLLYTNTQTIGGTGNLVFGNGGGTAYLYRNAAATLTIGTGITISGSGTGTAILGWDSSDTINFQGTLNANVAGKTWYLGSLNNTGNINVSTGTVYVDTYSGSGTWTNTNTVGKGIAVSGGVLNLGDAFNASALGNIAQTGGTVNLTGTMTLDQTSHNLSSPGLTGLVINNGTILGGGNTLTANAGFALSSSNGTLNNVTLATDLAVNGSTYLVNGLTLAQNAATLNNATVTVNATYLHYTGSQTLGGTGNLVFGGGSTGYLYRNGAAATLTVGSGITVSGSGTNTAIIGWDSGDTINFQGTLNANAAGKTWYLGSFANTGNINVSAGTVYVDTYSGSGAWTNTNTVGKGIAVSGGVLNLGDSFTTTGIGRITRSGGSINITGTLDNTGQTLDIGAAGPFGTGGLTALTGTIANGTLVSNDGALLNTPSGTLDGVTIGSNLGFTGGYAYINNHLLLANGITVNKGNTEWYFRTTGTQNLATVSGSATINNAGGGTYAGWGVAGQTLQVGSGITFQGYGTFGDSSAATIVNNGTLIANTAGQTFTLNPTNLTNNGTLRVTAGTLTVNPTNWTNSATGSIQAQGGTLTLNGTNLGNSGALSLSAGSVFNLGGTVTVASLGSFTRAAGSTVNLTGTLNLGGGTLDIGSAGPFGSGGLSSLTGTLANGTIISGDGTLFNSPSGTLDGITIGSNLGFTGSYAYIFNHLLLANGITVNKGGTEWYFRTTGTQNLATVSGSATINNAGGGTYAGWGVAGQTLQVGSGITFQGYGTFGDSSVATIVNNGTLIANAAGQTFTLNPTNLTNNGTLRVTAGTLTVNPTNWTNTGTISIQGGSFSLSGSNLVNTGTTTVDPGATLTLTGNLTLASLGTFSRGAGSSINLAGNLALGGGTLDIGSAGAFGTGGLTSLTGTIANGTLVSNDGTVFNTPSGTLDGITLGSNLGFSGGYAYVFNNLLLANGITVNKGNTEWYFRTTGTQNLATVSGSATINNAGGGTYAGWGVAGQTLQVGSGITFQGYGTFGDSSAATIVNNGTLIANAAGQTFTLNPTTLTNNGLITAAAGTFGLSPTTATNTGTLRIQSGGVMNTGASTTLSSPGSGIDLQSGGVFGLNGNYTISGGGLAVVTGATVNLESGMTVAEFANLNFQGGEAVLSSTLTNGGTLTLNGSGGTLRLASSGRINGGTVTTSGGVELASSGGILDAVTLDAEMTVINGGTLQILNGLTFANGHQISLEANAGSSTLYINGTGTQTLGGTGGIAFVGSGNGHSVSYSTGTPSLVIGPNVTIDVYSGGGNFWNVAQPLTLNGTLNMGAAGATLRTNVSGLVRGGGSAVNVTAGTLLLNGANDDADYNGAWNVAAGATLQLAHTAARTLGAGFSATGTGRVVVDQGGAATTINGMANSTATFAVNNGGTLTASSAISLGGLDLSSSSTVNGASAITVTGDMTMSNGTLSGAGSLAIGGNLLWSGGTIARTGGVSVAGSGSTWSAGTLNGGTLTNTGTLRVTGASGNTVLTTATLANNGSLIVDKTGGVFYINTSGILSNAAGGTFDLQSDLGITSSTGGGSISNAGTLTKTAGTAAAISTLVPVNFTNGSTVDVAAGREISFAGGGSFAGTVTGSGVGGMVDGGNWSSSGGTLAGNWQWRAGTLNSGTLTNTGMLRITGVSGTAILTTATLANSGSVIIDKTGGVFYLNTSGVIDNLAGGTLDLQADAIAINSSTGGGSITNAGILTKTAGTSTSISTLVPIAFSNGSSSAVAAGRTILMQGGGSFAGTVNGTGVGTTLDGGNWASTAGTLTGNWQWRSGALNSGTLTNAGTLRITGTSGNAILAGATLANNGSLLIDKTGGVFYINTGGIITNNGVTELQGSLGITSSTGGGSFNNVGIFRQTSASSLTVNALVPFTQGAAALIDVQAGTLTIGALAGSSNPGVITLASGATLVIGGNLTNTGTISGAGTLNLGANTLTNNGFLSPGTGGDATGTLTIVGNLVLGASSFLVAQLDSTAVGDFDMLAVSGNVNYGGTLTLNGAATSGSYSIVTSATRTAASTFTTVNGALAGANPSYSGTAMNILIALGGHWTGLGDGITWTSAANWGLSTLPGAGDDVFITTAGPTIVISSGAQAINSITVAAGRTLQITGGSLTVAQPSSFGGDVALAGGTLVFNGATSIAGNFTQTGGTLGGTGTLTLTGATNSWSGTSGSWTGGGSVVLTSGAGLTFSGTGTGNTFAGRTLTIDAGATATVSGNIELDPGTNVIANAGTLNLTGTAIRHANGGQGSLTLTNTGTINKTGAGTFILGSSPVAEHVALTNSGTLNVNAGTLAYVGGTGTSNGTVNLLAPGTWQTDGATMNFAAGSLFNSAGTILTSGGTANFLMPTANFTQTGNITTSGGTVNFTPDVAVPQINLSGGVTNFNGSATTPAFTQTGGTLGGTGTLTLTGATNSWSGTSGSWTGGGSVVLTSGAGLTFSGTGTGNTFAGRTLTIDAGATATVSGNIELDPGTNVIANAGTLNLTGTAIRHANGGQGSLTLTNTGTINKTGAGTFILGSSPVAEHVALTNSGTLNVNAGTLAYVGGTGTSNGTVNLLAPGTWQTDGATMNFAAGSLFNSAGTILTSGGTANFLMPTANFTQTGNITTSGGTVNFTPDVAVPQINLSGGVTNFNGSATTPAFTQTGGTLGGTGTLTLTGATNSWSGTSGSWTGGGSVVLTSGAGLTFSGTGTGNTFAGRTLTIDAGATATVSGNIELDPGTNVIANAGTLNLTGTAIRHANGGQGSLTLTNTGTINKTGAGTFILGSSPVAEHVSLTNSGFININAGTLAYAGGTGTSNGIVNLLAPGTWQTDGATMNFAGGSTFNSAGTILTSGGTANFLTPTANFTQTGNIVTTGGTANFLPDVNVPQLTLSGGVTNFNASATTPSFTQSGGTLGGAGTLTLTGATNAWSGTSGSWTGGGSVVLTSGAGLTFSGTGTGNVFAGRTLTIDAGATATVSGNIELDPGTNVIANAGTLNLTGTAIRHANGGQGSLTLTNTGTINKTGAGTFILGSSPVAEHVALTNSGVINVNAGTLDHVGGTLTQSSLLEVAAGATFSKQGGFTNGAGGTLAGEGTIDVGAGNTLTNNGNVAPGATSGDTTGSLSIIGNFVQGAGGTLMMQLDSTAAGNYDQLAVSGSAALNGTLNLTGAATSGTFALVNAASRSGTFSALTGPVGGNSNYTATGFSFDVILGLFWTGAVNNEWSNPGNWSTGVLPGVTDFITIGTAGSLTLSSGSYAIRGINTVRNFTLSGGAILNFAEPSTIGGNVTLNSGTLTGVGPLAIGGALNVVAASTIGVNTTVSGLTTVSAGGLGLSGATTFTANGGLDWSGGSLSGSGASSFVLPVGQSLNVSGGTKEIWGATLQNGGTVNLNLAPGNNLQLSSGGSFNNIGTVNFNDNNAITLRSGFGPGSFNNVGGTLAVAAGKTGSVTVENATFSGNGTLDTSAAGSVLTLAPTTTASYSGTLTAIGSGLSFANGGAQHNFASGTVLNGTFNQSTGNTVFDNATLNGVYNLQGGTFQLATGATALNGTFNYAGGSISGNTSLVLTAGDVLNVTGGTKEIWGATLQNGGTVNLNLAPGNNLQLSSGGSFNNTGTINFNDNNAIALRSGFGIGTFNNLGGTLVVAAGKTGSVTLENATFSGNGTLDTSAIGSALTLAPTNAANYSGTLTAIGSGVSFANGGAAHTFASGSVLNGTFNQSTGNTVFDNATLNGVYNLQGGTFQLATGATALNGTFNYAGGSISGNTSLVLTAGDVLNVTGGTKEIWGATLQNGGTVNLNLSSGNVLQFSNGGTFTNTGTVAFNDNTAIAARSGFGPGTFNNLGGTLVVAAGRTGSVSVENASFSGNSILDTSAAGSLLALAPALAANYSGTLNALGTGVSFANGGATHTFASGSVLNGSFTQSTGNTSFNNTTLNTTYHLQGGTLSLAAGSSVLNGTLNYAGGVIAGAGGTTLALSAGDVLNVTGGTKEIWGATLQNGGTVNLNLASGNNLQLSNGGSLTNTGMVNFNDNVAIAARSGFGPGTFNNAGGTLAVAAGKSGSVTVENASFSGNSIFDTSAPGSSFVLAPSASANYAGSLDVIGNGVSFAAGGATHLVADGTMLNGNMTLAGGAMQLGSVLILGDFVHSGGSLATGAGKTLNVVAGGSLTLANGATLGGSGSLINEGTVNFSNNTLAHAIQNSGAMVLNGANTFTGGSFMHDGGTLTLASAGALTKSGGTFQWTGGDLQGVGSGLSLTGGATATISGGGSKVLNGVNVTAISTDVVTGTLEVQAGNLSSGVTTIAAGATLLHSGGSLTTGALTNNGTFRHTGTGSSFISGGGTHTGTFIADTGAGIEFSGGAHVFNGATFSGGGAFSRTGATMTVGAGGLTVGNGTAINLNALALGGAGPIVNNGTVAGNGVTWGGNFTNGSTGTLQLTNGGIAGDFLNYGTFDIAGTVVLSGAVADQLGGQIRIPSGAVLERTTGPFRWVNGTVGGDGSGTGNLSFTGGGSFQFAGTGDRVIDGLNFTFNNLTLPNGSLTLQSGSLTLNGSTVLPTGVALNLNGGTLANNGTLDIGGSFDLAGGAFTGAGSLTMSGGSLNLPAGNSVAWTNTGALTNTGTLNLAAATITNAIDNQGTINAGNGLVFTQTFINNGTLVLGAGTTTFNNGLVQNAGMTQMNNGTVNGIVTINAGTMMGGGTVNGSLTVNGGTLAVGFSPGTLNIAGSLVLGGASTTAIELGGTGGGQYDLINVGGNAALDGALVVTYWGGFSGGGSFPVMSWGSSSGSFASTSFPAAGFTLAYGASGLLLDLPTGALPVVVSPVADLLAALQTNQLVVLLDGLDPEGSLLAEETEEGGIVLRSAQSGAQPCR